MYKITNQTNRTTTMKKLNSYTELQVGGIYNRVYIGPKEAFKPINGKETFLVMQTTPVLKLVTLFDPHGRIFTDDLSGNPWTMTHPELGFGDYEIYEPKDESEWFKKSVRVNSLSEGLQQNLLTLAGIKERSRGYFNTMFGLKVLGYENGYYCSFSVEGKTEHPLLQYVYVTWKTREDLRADFAKHGSPVERL